jgi:hypothetical protein
VPSTPQLLLFPVAVAINLLAIEWGTYTLYGKSTFRVGSVQRLPYKLAMRIDGLLLLTALIAPWVVLITHGLAAANLAWICVSLAAAVVINVLGLLIEWFPPLFIDTDAQLRLMRELPLARRRGLEQTMADWPTMDAEAKERYRQVCRDQPIHFREAIFALVLESFPMVPSQKTPCQTLTRLTTAPLRHWGGGHLFNHIDALLDMRHRVSSSGLFEGELSVTPDHREFPECSGPIRFVRVADDLFAIGPAKA